ncbi:GNAT family N-acetyltransferase [Oryzibacter oryziterrae]|uniref:GNAT family N-acetyltransferase n=1 Tax=Oryzibacter oryziterrae TaxID=2766474 RepID=UPI001F38529B|nr:GNAT family N-acetyltransferase [Oryzibacter oryziterrae]
MTDIRIHPLDASSDTIEQLATLIVETVAGGGSVSFMHPMELERARDFWWGSLEAAARGDRVVLGAIDNGRIVGTVTLITSLPPNQPHRAEISKMMTAASHRGRGIAMALLKEAERIAIALGRPHLMLDTASDGGAAGLYEKAGFHFVGEVPDFALKPHGGLTGTRFYWKQVEPASSQT